MLGAICGDVLGSYYEWHPMKDVNFQPLLHPESRFTDDTVLTCAVAEWIQRGIVVKDAPSAILPLQYYLRKWFRYYPEIGYGPMFYKWASSPEDLPPYGSFGNGSAMRVSPVAWMRQIDADYFADGLTWAKISAEKTHNHPEGIKGALAVANAIMLIRAGVYREFVRSQIAHAYQYDLHKTVDQIRSPYRFDATCQGSVPEALTCALQSTSWEDAVRQAISLGGDADTQACIAGAVAEALYGGVPKEIAAPIVEQVLDSRIREFALQWCKEFKVPVLI